MDQGATDRLINQTSGLDWERIPPQARTVARHCVLDWCGVALAGSLEPLSGILVRALACSARGEATLRGHECRAGVLDAALINGASSHALDFDDTHTLMSGH